MSFSFLRPQFSFSFYLHSVYFFLYDLFGTSNSITSLSLSPMTSLFAHPHWLPCCSQMYHRAFTTELCAYLFIYLECSPTVYLTALLGLDPAEPTLFFCLSFPDSTYYLKVCGLLLIYVSSDTNVNTT